MYVCLWKTTPTYAFNAKKISFLNILASIYCTTYKVITVNYKYMTDDWVLVCWQEGNNSSKLNRADMLLLKIPLPACHVIEMISWAQSRSSWAPVKATNRLPSLNLKPNISKPINIKPVNNKPVNYKLYIQLPRLIWHPKLAVKLHHPRLFSLCFHTFWALQDQSLYHLSPHRSNYPRDKHIFTQSYGRIQCVQTHPPSMLAHSLATFIPRYI